MKKKSSILGLLIASLVLASPAHAGLWGFVKKAGNVLTGGAVTATEKTYDAVGDALDGKGKPILNIATGGWYECVGDENCGAALNFHDSIATGGLLNLAACAKYPDLYDCGDALTNMAGNAPMLPGINFQNFFDEDKGFTNAQEVMATCELEVTDDRVDYGTEKIVARLVGPNPCMMIGRLGTFDKESGKYSDNSSDCSGYQENLAKSDSEDVYFDCRDHGRLKSCKPDSILEEVSLNSKQCDVGKFDERQVQLVFPQVEHVATPYLHNRKDSVESMGNFVPVEIDSSSKIEMDLGDAAGRWIIISDARAFVDSFDDKASCVGKYCGKSNKPDSSWLKPIVNDEPFVDSASPILDSYNFDGSGRVTILEPNGSDAIGAEMVGRVPFVIDGLSEGEFAITITGPKDLGKNKLKPRVDLRGAFVSNKTAGGFIKTKGHVELIIERGLFEVHENGGPLFDLSPETSVEFSDSRMKVNPNADGAIYMSSKTDIDVSGGFEIEIIGSNPGAPFIIYDDVDSSKVLDQLIGLEISYTVNSKFASFPLPLMFVTGAGEEVVFECQAGDYAGCADESDSDQILTVSADEVGKILEMKIQSIPLTEGVDPIYAYAASGGNYGARLILKDSAGVDDVDADDVGDEDVAEDDVAPADEVEDEEGKNAENASGEKKGKDDCLSGEYWSNHFGKCMAPSGASHTEKAASAGDADDSSDGNGDIDVGGALSNGERVIGEDVGDKGPAAEDEAPSGGCSMVPVNASANAMNMILALIAFVAFLLCRRIAGRRPSTLAVAE